MGEVIHIPGLTKVDEPPESILEKAKSWEMEHCVVVGYDSDGRLAFGGTTSNLEKIITLLERAKHWCIAEMED